MKQKIIELLDKKDLSLTWEEIKDSLELKTTEEYRELSQALNELLDDYILHYTSKKKYLLFKYSHLNSKVVKGVFSSTSHDYGFVRVDGEEEDIFVHVKNSMGAINDDVVLVEKMESPKDKKTEGRIIKILKRTTEAHVGTVHVIDNKIVVDLDDKKFKEQIYIRDETKKGLVEGHKVLVKLLNNKNKNDLSGTVVKVIGHINDPKIDVLSILYEYGFNPDFSPETLEELKKIPDSLTEEEIAKEIKKGRRDLRDQEIFTIDGDDTKDIDDAISLEMLPNGNYKLGVHIADVSYYVKENSSLFKDAFERGTSVYIGDYVAPMLPHLLSNGICSLNEGVDRYAISCVMEINSKGEVVDQEIFPSVIKSRKKMTYKNVNSVLENNVVPSGYEPFKDTLLKMGELSKIIRTMKEKRGATDFDTDENKKLIDENDVPYEVILRYRGLAEKLIEDFMIMANETIASVLFHMDLPSIYRVHDLPDVERLREFIEFLATLGYTYKGDLRKVTPKVVQEILELIHDKKEFPVLTNQLLRCMAKAIYSLNNIGHFAIASGCYTHFTSPIRRLCDLVLHMIIRAYLFEGRINQETVGYFEKKIPEWALQASIKEREADDAEREGEALYDAKYMEKFIGHQFDGMISEVTNFGIFVRLDNVIEGLVPIDELGNYTCNEALKSLVDRNKRICYRLGDKVTVEVTRVSVENRTIDFKVIKRNDYNEKGKEKVKVRTA